VDLSVLGEGGVCGRRASRVVPWGAKVWCVWQGGGCRGAGVVQTGRDDRARLRKV